MRDNRGIEIDISDGVLTISIDIPSLKKFSKLDLPEFPIEYAEAVVTELLLEDDNNQTIVDELFEVACEAVDESS